MKDLKERGAVVTGTASGIGLGVTERFPGECMKVVIADGEPELLDRQAKRPGDAEGDVLPVVCDVRELEEIRTWWTRRASIPKGTATTARR